MSTKVAGKGLVLDGVVEPSSKKPKKAVAAKTGAGKRKVREEEEAGDEGHKKRGAVERGVDLESPALRNGEEVDEEDSPAPVKKGRKVVEAKVVAKKEKTNGNAQAAELLGRRMRNGRGAENIESGSEEDMFAASPSPVKKVANREFKEMGSQVNLSLVVSFIVVAFSGESSICGSRQGGQEERQSGSCGGKEEGFGHDPNSCHAGGERQG